jgi:hypothetical protein
VVVQFIGSDAKKMSHARMNRRINTLAAVRRKVAIQKKSAGHLPNGRSPARLMGLSPRADVVFVAGRSPYHSSPCVALVFNYTGRHRGSESIDRRIRAPY